MSILGHAVNADARYGTFSIIHGNQSNTTHNVVHTDDHEKILSALKPVDRRGYDVPGCMKGTRQDVFSTVDEWLDDFGAPNILWVSGSPGAGKSAIASSLVSQLSKRQQLASYFIFKRNDASFSNPNNLWRTVASDLARFSSDVKGSLVDFLKGVQGMRDADINLHFECLIEAPLRKHHEKLLKPVVIVIDAMDECGCEAAQSSQRRMVLETVVSWSRLPSAFKLFFTSRDERLPDSFYDSRFCRRIILETGDTVSSSTRNGIRVFLEERFADIRPDLCLPPTWPGEFAMDQMADRAAGLFIWAKTAVDFLEEENERGNPRTKLDLILSGKLGKGTDNIDALYRQVLDFHFKNSDDTMLELFTMVLGAIVVAKTPFRHGDLKHFLCRWQDEDSRQIGVIIRRLSSVISKGDDDGSLRLKHLSFAEFLSDARRCHDRRFFINRSQQHHNLTLACLRLMNEGLKFNICNLETSYRRNDDVDDLTSRIETFIPSYLSYSCRNWAEHLSGSMNVKHNHANLLKAVKNFLHIHLLYWFEVLSLIKEVSLASTALNITARWTAPFDTELSAFATDASRFVTNFHTPISESVPHIYLSALPFSPLSSTVSKHYAPQFPQTLSVITGLEEYWSALTNIFIGHTDDVLSVAFSPNGKCVVSGSRDKTIRIWDTETGQMTLSPFEGHTDDIRSVAFSPNGKRIVSGSFDKTIRIWNADTGHLVSGPFEGHTDYVLSVAFSPDGKHVVSGSLDMMIWVWDAETGQMESNSFKGHTDAVTSVAFSPDKKHIVSGSHDKTIRVWDVGTGQMALEPFRGHTNPVFSVAFSVNGRRVVSGSQDSTVRIWDAETGQMVLGPLGGHTGAVVSVAFSPDEKYVVSGSQDKAIRIWDAETGQMSSGPFEGHTDIVRSVAFSPDGKHVISGSSDKTVRIWDAGTRQMASGSSEEHALSVSSVAFSPDGKRVISGSSDKTIRIWNAETGRLVSGPFIGHTDDVQSVAFSPGGRLAVSGSLDKTIRIWDTETGQMVSGPFEGHTDGVRSVAFSPDGERVVSGSYDCTIRIWDVESGDIVSGPFEGHTLGVGSVAFSPDGKCIVSGSNDRTIRIWRVETGQMASAPLEGHTSHIESVAFSPSGSNVISGSYDKTIRIWDVQTGQVSSGPFKGHSNVVCSVAFSPDGKHVVSGSSDKTIRIWDAAMGQTVSGPFEGHTDGVCSVAFSPDGKRCVSSSQDKTIRIWDVDVRQMALGPYEDHMHSAATSPDGTSVTWGSQDKMIKINSTDNSTLANSVPGDFSQGWICCPDSQGSKRSLLFWVPLHHRRHVYSLRTIVIMGMQRTRFDFTGFVHGSSWTQCHSSFPTVDQPLSNNKDVSVPVDSMPVKVLIRTGYITRYIGGLIVLCLVTIYFTGIWIIS